MQSIQLIRFSVTDGKVDPTFRLGGTQRASFVQQDLVRRIVADSDVFDLSIDPLDRIVVAGSGIPITFPVGTRGTRRFGVARFNSDGSEDDTFSTDGFALAPNVNQSGLEVGVSRANALTLDSAGRILAAGRASIEDASGEFVNEFAVSRLNSNGTFDDSFMGGFVTTNIAPQRRERANAITTGPAGRVVVAGEAVSGGGQSFLALTRYRQTGTLDTTFSTDGKTITDIPTSGRESAAGVTVDHLGRIIVAGTLNIGQGTFGLIRYTASGTLDGTFGSTGTVSTSFSESTNEGATCIAVDSQDRIVSAGFAQVGNFSGFAVSRHRIDGTLDSTFSGDGRHLVLSANLSGGADAVAIDSRGRIVLAGVVVSPDEAAIGQVLVVRLTPNGERDSNFGDEGRILTSIEGGFSINGLGMAIDSRDRIVVAATREPNFGS